MHHGEKRESEKTFAEKWRGRIGTRFLLGAATKYDSRFLDLRDQLRKKDGGGVCVLSHA